MNRKKKPISIVVTGRLWFDRKNGNTYHSFTAYLDGVCRARCDIEYGYGNQYLVNAFKALVKNSVLKPPKKHSNGITESFNSYCERNKITLNYEAVNVSRKKDLY